MRIQFKEKNEHWIYKKGLTFLLPIYILAAIAYVYWRFHNAEAWQAWYAFPLFAIEVYGILFSVSHLLTTRKQLEPVWQRPERGNSTVDIFITTYNEPEDIVKMTAIGALEVRGARKVFILDDGNRPNIKELATTLGTEYVARTTNEHAKAGNMNNGIKYSDAEFIVFLDCDHVPQANFIERTLGYFNDRNLAFVQTPQLFYNEDSFQFRKTGKRNMWNEQSMFYESIQPAKNRYNAAFFCGSGSMLRRIAINEVGGFATGTATEDIHTSLRLHAKGWDSVFINEQLAHGIAAEDLSEYHKQRVRWGAGSLGLLFRSKDSPLRTRGLTFMQRVCYINSTIAFLGGIQRFAFIMLPVLVILTLPINPAGSMPVVSYLMMSSIFVVFSYLITYIFSRGTFHPIYTEQFNIVNIFSNFLATKGILNVQKKFKVSIKQRRPKTEANAYRGLLILWFTTFVAWLGGLQYWFFYQEKSLGELGQSVAGAAMFWNFINLLLIGSVVWYVNFHNEKVRSKHNVRAIESAKTNLMPAFESGFIGLERVSLKGADVILNAPIARKSLDMVLNIDNSKDVILKAKVNSIKKLKDGNYRVFLGFPKLNIQQDKLMTRYIFDRIVPELFDNDYRDSHKINWSFSTYISGVARKVARNPS